MPTALDRALPFIKMENVEAKISKGVEGACWEWTGAKFPKGHPAYCAWDPGAKQRIMVRVHRLMHFLNTGEQPEAVMHRCDNAKCCNPAHLESGTVEQNNLDRDARGRVRHGERHADAKLTAEDVQAIRAFVGTQAACAEQFGISPSNVSMIRAGKRWARTP